MKTEENQLAILDTKVTVCRLKFLTLVMCRVDWAQIKDGLWDCFSETGTRMLVVSRASYNSIQGLSGIESPGWRISPFFAAFLLELNPCSFFSSVPFVWGLGHCLCHSTPFSALGPGLRPWLAPPHPILRLLDCD